MTKKEFLALKPGEIILKGKRKAAVLDTFNYSGGYVEFTYLDTKRASGRGYRGLKVVKEKPDEA